MRAHLRRRAGVYAGAAGLLSAILVGAGGGHLAGHHALPAAPTPVAAEGGGRVIGHCGLERWSVKTGTDPDAHAVGLTPVPGSVAQLVSLPAPASPPPGGRVSPTELTVYTIHATLAGYKQEADSDYHLVVSDTGRTMIVEIPNPGCVGASSPFRAQIAQARAKFDARYAPGPAMQAANVAVTVTGVGFFDRIHGQTGVAPNGIELHPVLDIAFP